MWLKIYIPIGENLVHCYPKKKNVNIVINPFCANAPVITFSPGCLEIISSAFFLPFMAFFFGFDNFSLNYNICTINEEKNSIKREDI